MIEKVRDKANELYTHFAGLFDVSVSEFARFFESTVTEFRDATKEMDKDALLELIVDPTITPAWGKLFLLRVVHFLKYKKKTLNVETEMVFREKIKNIYQYKDEFLTFLVHIGIVGWPIILASVVQ